MARLTGARWKAIDVHKHNESSGKKLPVLRAIVPAYPAIHQSGFQDKPTTALEEGLAKSDPSLLEEIDAFFKGLGAIDFKTK